MMLSPKHDFAATQPCAIRSCRTRHVGFDAGKKIEQARDALRFFLARCGRATLRRDSVLHRGAAVLREGGPATKENLDRAVALADGLEARGGTNIDEALAAALAPLPADLPAAADHLFLTDGQPTVGTPTPAAAADVRSATRRSAHVRVRVGHDVNTRLLDTMAERAEASATTCGKARTSR